MTIRPIEYGSAEYHAACDLRRRFLREPLGLTLTDNDVAGEGSQHHFGLYDDQEQLIGGVIGKRDAADPSAVRIRQMVVHPDRRERGLGRKLLTEAERALAAHGYERFVLWARAEATGFYERCGYRLTGATDTMLGLEHLEMRKTGATAS